MWLLGFQMKTNSGADAFYVAKNTEYVDALKVAILSARKHAQSLIPVVVLTGPRSSDHTALEKWLHRHDSITINHTLSFQRDMDALSKDPAWAFSQNVLGSWLRVDLPSVLQTLWEAVSASRIPKNRMEDMATVNREFVLWTDPDVIFRGAIDSCTLAQPRVLSVGPEFRMGWPENYGVIYFNESGYAATFEDLIKWARLQNFHFNHDQHLFSEYWRTAVGTAVTVLPDGMNWKPYWGNASTAIPGQFEHGLIKIVHFHGPKLSTAICYFDLLTQDGRSGIVHSSLDMISKCGLKAAPNGSRVWLQLLADILVGAHRQDGGFFYRELHEEHKQYLNTSMVSRPGSKDLPGLIVSG